MAGLQVASLFGLLSLKDEFSPGLKAAEKNTQEFGKGVGGAIEKINALSSAMGAVPGAAFLLGAVKAASDFDKTMTNVGSIMGKTKDQMNGISQEVLKIGRNSVAGAQATAEAFTDIVGGVADASTHMAILDAAIATSEAGQASLQSTTSGLVSVMNAYKFSADKASFASDVLTQTVGVGVGSMEQMVSAIAPISGLAASAGIKFNDMGAAIAFMTTKGQSAAQASTQYKAAIVALLNPNAQMAAAIKKTGAESGSAMIKQFGLVGALNKLKASVGGSQDAMAKMMGSVEALQAVTALATDDFGDFSENFERGMTGATEAARKIQLESFSAQFEIFKNNLIGVAIAAGNVLLPALGGLFNIINRLMGLINQFDPNLLGLVAAFTALSVVIPALLPLFGLLVGALAPLLVPIAALTGAFTAVKLAWETDFGGIRTSITKFWSDVQPTLNQIKTGVETFFNILNEPVKMTLDTEGMDAAGARLTKKLNALDPNDALTKGAEIDFGTKLKNAIDTAWPIVQPAIQSLIDQAVALIGELIPNLINAVVTLGSQLATTLGNQLSQVDWGSLVANLLTSALNFGANLIANILSGLTNLYTDLTKKISEIDAVDIGAQAATLLSKALQFGADLIANIVSGLTGGKGKIEGQFTAETSGINLITLGQGLLDAAFNFSTTLIGKIIDGLSGFANKIKTELETKFNGVDIGAAIKKLLDDALKAGDDLWQNIVKGISDASVNFQNDLADKLNGINWEQVGIDLAKNAMKIGKAILDALFPPDTNLGDKLSGEVDKAAANSKLHDAGQKLGKALIKAIGDALTGIGEVIAGKLMEEMSKNTPDWLLGLMGTNKTQLSMAANVLQAKTGTASAPAAPTGQGTMVGQQANIPAPVVTDQKSGVGFSGPDGTPSDPVNVTVAANPVQQQQQGAQQPNAPLQPPNVAPVAQQAAGQAGFLAAAGGQNPVEPIVQAAVAWLETTGRTMLTAAFKSAMDAGAAAFSAAGLAQIPSGVMNPLNLAMMWVNTVGRAGVVTTFAALAASANASLKGVGSSMVSSVADALIRIATMIGNLPNGVGAQLAAGIRAAAASGRARGGAIGSGLFLVGENGPELIQLGAGQSGHVFENSLVRGAKGNSSGGNSGGIVLNNPVFQGVQDPESLLQQLEDVAGRYNMTIQQPR